MKDAYNNRILGPPKTINIPQGALPIIEHPESDVDLAALLLAPIQEQFARSGGQPHIVFLTKEAILSFEIEQALQVATSVLMVGFPNGIMDEQNNFPVTRRGILATPFKLNCQGKSNFVVDIASFGGSSGSPVFAYFENMVPDGKGNISMMTSPTVMLLGVLHSGPVMNINGEIVPVPVPTTKFITSTNVMMHLRYCVKAHKIEELFSVIRHLL